MIKLEKYDHDIDQDLIKKLSKMFDPSEFVENLDNGDIEDKKSAFREYGSNLIEKSIELGEQSTDRTLEVMEQVAEKTGELKFPLFPQRYIELAYLSIEPFKRLWIDANSPKIFSYELKNCNVYDAIEKNYGEEACNKMACQETCFAILEGAFDHFDFDVEKSLEMNMAEDGKCLFKVKKKE